MTTERPYPYKSVEERLGLAFDALEHEEAMKALDELAELYLASRLGTDPTYKVLEMRKHRAPMLTNRVCIAPYPEHELVITGARFYEVQKGREINGAPMLVLTPVEDSKNPFGDW